jgi:topoisomerase-4 subunit A
MADEDPEFDEEVNKIHNEGGGFSPQSFISGMYQEYFLDYASYVILERAVPALEDGLKPVQRRILHSMMELEDGRYNKVANVIGNTMKYHPHGDMSITDAMVQLGQKEILIDTQGNWGNIMTGDSAAASRYIEARLTAFAKEVVFNPKTTEWNLSYDGRNREPVTLPVKFPLLLAQGVEGIAVGLACKIMPHNFNELIDASIQVLKGKPVELYPDFPTAGMVDVSKYNSGLRGGKLRIRARISIQDPRTLCVTEIPFGTTTGSLIDSVISANEKGKIKVKKIEDNTAQDVEILIHLHPGTSPDQTLDALYAFTDCEISVSPNSTVIYNQRPEFISVEEILTRNTAHTKRLLEMELNIREGELQEDILYTSLEKIFIENRIYRDIEECETWDAILEVIDQGLSPFKPLFYREITVEDIAKLTEIRIKRISKFDGFKADEKLRRLNEELEQVRANLATLTDYAIEWYKELKRKYGKGRERKTEIRSFESIEATKVVARTEKLYFDQENGFAGYGLKNANFISECSDIDDIVVIREDGTMMVTRVSEKSHVGKGLLHIAVWNRDDDRTVYHMLYRDGKNGPVYMKRFQVSGITRDKEYDLTKGSKDSAVVYFSVNPNGESETLTIYLKPRPKLRKQVFDINLGELAVKGRAAQGNLVSKSPIRRIVAKERGESTLGALKFWLDEETRRLNADERGRFLGGFNPGDRLIEISKSGNYRLLKPDLSLHFEDDAFLIERYEKDQVVTLVYFDAEKTWYMVKRFLPETEDKPVGLIGDHPKSYIETASLEVRPVLQLSYLKGVAKDKTSVELPAEDLVAPRGEKAKGNKLAFDNIKKISWGQALAVQEIEQAAEQEVSKETEKDAPGSSDESTGYSPGTVIDFGDDQPTLF